MLSLAKKMLSQSKINIFLVLFIYKLIYITINSKFTNHIYNNIVIKYNLLYHLYNLEYNLLQYIKLQIISVIYILYI